MQFNKSLLLALFTSLTAIRAVSVDLGPLVASLGEAAGELFSGGDSSSSSSDKTRSLNRREEAAPLTGPDGPSHKDIVCSGKWNSTWLAAPLGGWAHGRASKEFFELVLRDTGSGRDKPKGAPTDKAEFTVSNKEGVKEAVTIEKKDVSPDADWKTNWWFGGFETAFLTKGGFAGLDDDMISGGDPAEAIRMFAGFRGFTGIYEDRINEKDTIKVWLNQSPIQPIVFQTKGLVGADTDPSTIWAWYTALELTDDNKLIYWDYVQNKERTEKFDDVYAQMSALIHC